MYLAICITTVVQSMLSLGESGKCPGKKLKITCQETLFGGISAKKQFLKTVCVSSPSWLTSAVAKSTI